MIWTKSNYKKGKEKARCRRCEKEDETTEHVLECHAGIEFKRDKIEEVTKYYEEIDELNREEERITEDKDNYKDN